MTRPKPRERQFILDYITARYPDNRVKYNCPLGLPPARLVATFGLTQSLKLAMGSRLMVDAVVWEDNKLILVEAKIREWVNGIAKLPIYKMLVPTTPELEEYWSWPVEMVLALPYTSDYIESTAELVGVRVDSYTSAAVDESMAMVQKYQTPEWRRSQAERRATLERLGLE